jgi:type I restriction enzyme M protein
MLTNRKPHERRGKVMLLDASGEDFWEPMRKNLGDKSRQISDAQRAKIVALVNARRAGGFVKIFDREDFGYRRIQVERPLRLNFCASAERLARLDEQAAFANLAVSKKKPGAAKDAEEAEGRELQAQLKKTLATLGDVPVKRRDRFADALGKAFVKAGLKLKAPLVKAILSALSERDETADICMDGDGKPEPDSELRDYENVPLKENIRDYFAREVWPHVPDAWINEDFRDEKDGEVGRVGYEIPFNRHFFQYQPPRPLGQIEADIKALEKEIVEMLKEVTA